MSNLPIGSPFGGGIMLGRLFVDDQPYTIVRAPQAALPKAWASVAMFDEPPSKLIAPSVYDGLANTRAYASAGSRLANDALALRIDGIDDWYIASRGELLLALAAGLKGPEAFERDWYWSSSQHADAPSCGYIQSFNDGTQLWVHLGNRCRVFAVRREPIR